MSGRAFYNDNDRFAAGRLRELTERGLIEPGVVDDRSILELRASDLNGFERCHLFAGIGGWAYALRLADAEDIACWTASVPCQPLSAVGRRKGHVDERHLWPALCGLIAECRPAVVFGEQVAGADGREWLAGVRADLEQLGYACGAADIPAASAGAPHKRQRLWWVAGRVGNAERARLEEWRRRSLELPDAQQRQAARRSARLPSLHGHWHKFDLAYLSDGTARPIEPKSFPLADGISERVGRLRAFGNAIVPQVAAAFIVASLEALAVMR